MSAEDRGPFRSADPTVDALHERDREASFERVNDATMTAIARERRRKHRLDRIAWTLFAFSLGAAAVVLVLTALDAAIIPFVCPAIAAALASGIVVFHRRPRDRRR